MPRRTVGALGLALALLLHAPSARAVICTTDPVPAATLLVPYFAVDLDACEGPGTTTSFTINNATASAAITHVVLWSDWSVPVLDFDVFVTGFDVQEIDLKAVLCRGELPATGGFDTPPPTALDASTLAHLRAWLTGNQSPLSSNCAGSPRADSVAVGYVTVDNYTSETTGSPADGATYLAGLSSVNQLWGSWSLETVTTREEPVPCQSCADLKGRKKKKCRREQRLCADAPQTTTVTITSRSRAPTVAIEASDTEFTTGERTFYGRYAADTAVDKREPLPTSFGVEYAQVAERADYGLVVWREGTADAAGVLCGERPTWFPLPPPQIVAFDQEENPAEVSRALPQETEHVEEFLENVPFDDGWLFLNLARPAPSAQLGQAWVTILREGRIDQAGVLPFDSGCSPAPPLF